MYNCKHCGRSFEDKRKLGGHSTFCKSRNLSFACCFKCKKELGRVHLTRHLLICGISSPRVKSDGICKYCGKKFENTRSVGMHSVTCSKRPGSMDSREKTRSAQLGKPISEQVKAKISKSMKKAHSDGRAWNIGQSRWNNEPSYPETFIMKVIANEFFDTNYIYEFPVGIYSIDFAWPSKKKAIEIDGQQHQRFEEYKKRDIKKDKLLVEHGWDVLRLSWTDICNDTKAKIQEMKSFIGK